jgi:polysaccharide biosynthesis transport protein
MVFGERHPRVHSLESERRGIARTIEEELNRLARNAELEYEVALAHEQSLERRLRELEGVTVGANRALVTLREMQREVEAARAVYEAFLTRTKQTSEQENLSANNVRILARGEMPHRPAYPPAAIVLAAALFIGLMVGALLAWVRDLTART